ncbi:MAG: S8 family serine peptidase [Actinomycetota bacterium]|nr:S8 family serine peptidase [Actinomycetota bacterium]
MTLSLTHRRTGRSAILALILVLFIGGTPAAEALGKLVSVIVVGPSATAAAEATTGAGGRVDAPLPIVDGVLAHVPSSRIGELSTRMVVVPDRSVRVQSASFGQQLTTAYPAEVGAAGLWRTGVTGAGVTVALIDTGVANVPDLAGRVVASADLSPELSFTDGYGHGTFEAGLIAGNGASSGGRFVGVAPEANLMSVKVAAADGSSSLGRVLMGAQLVDSAASRFDVRVALLAIDDGSPLPPELDPLTQALRRLWADGITVVVPAGNGGADGMIASPGEDPVLLTAGSVNDMATPSVFDDTISSFTAHGPTRWGADKPDVAAPGEHLVSLRAPGSTIDSANPGSRVEGAYFKGSGTSMAAAVTAGAAALLLSQRPELSPDQVKAVLMGSANAIPAGDVDTVGAGVVNAADAMTTSAPTNLPPVPDRPGNASSFPWLQGRNFDWFGDAGIGYRWLAREWNAREWAARSWDARSWDAREWAAREWGARSWDAREWAARSWDAREWNAREWSAREWAAREWAAREWAAREWNAREWSARFWDAREWSAREWAARQWTSRTWDAREWNARFWDAREWSAGDWSARTWDGRSWDGRSWDSRTWDSRTWNARTWDSRTWDSRTWDAREWSAREWSARQWSSTSWT